VKEVSARLSDDRRGLPWMDKDARVAAERTLSWIIEETMAGA
jgi:hypothetical protein